VTAPARINRHGMLVRHERREPYTLISWTMAWPDGGVYEVTVKCAPHEVATNLTELREKHPQATFRIEEVTP
jgi:hypothetical protein